MEAAGRIHEGGSGLGGGLTLDILLLGGTCPVQSILATLLPPSLLQGD